MRKSLCLGVALALGSALAVGCDGDGDEMDSGVDSGVMDTDSGTDDDSGVDTDSGVDMDGGVDPDGGPDDAGMTDAGPPGGGAATSAQIQAVLDAADGAVDLMIEGAIVTYVKPAIDDGVDGAGFFVQAEQMGPALFVNVDPTGLSAPPDAGQVVDFRVTTRATDDSASGDGSNIPYAAAIDMWNVVSSGNDTSFLVQEVSAVDLVANRADYLAELISLTAVIDGGFGFAGTGFRAAQITTAGVTTASADFRFRVPAMVLEGSTLGTGCTVDLGPTPLWQFDTAAQPSAWREADFTVTACPEPAAGDLVITEIGYNFAGDDSDLEFIEIHNPSSSDSFDLAGCRLADSDGFTGANAFEVSSSLIVGPGQFITIAGSMSEIMGEATLPAALSFDDSDAAQIGCSCTAGADCAVTVDAVDWSSMSFPASMDDVSVQLDAAAVGPDGATNNDVLALWCLTPEGETYGTMSRRGTPGIANPPCSPPAVVRVNEVNANISGGCDLVELRVVSGGSLAGFELRERTSTVLTFPIGFSVATNDLIVVHFDSGDSSCNGGAVSAPADEVLTPMDQPSAVVSPNYDTAFDFWSSDSGITSTDNVIWLRDPAGTVVEAVLISDGATGTAAGGSESAAADVAAAGEWTMVGGGVPAGGFVDDDFNMHAVQDSGGTGTDASGESIQRNDDADMNDRDDWVQAASSWGALNAGQSAL